MELCTVGRHRPDYTLNIWHTTDLGLAKELGQDTHFRILLIEEGSGFLQLGEQHHPFVAPTIFCLNENENPQFKYPAPIRVQAIFFHPTVINSLFSFDQLRSGKANLSRSERYDTYWLRPFLDRDEGSTGHLGVGESAIHTVMSLFSHLQYELNQQPDQHWPCRSRSYLIELLFLVARLHAAASVAVSPAITLAQESENDINAVILYLHSHYQQKLTLRILADMFLTNRTTLNQQFRQATGTSVMTYLTQLRLRLAISMLGNTGLSIREIAYRVGFKDVTHFGRTFRKYFNCTPSTYRVQCKTNLH